MQLQTYKPKTINCNMVQSLFDREIGIKSNRTFKKDTINSLICGRRLVQVFHVVRTDVENYATALAFDSSGKVFASADSKVNLWYWNNSKILPLQTLLLKIPIRHLKFLNLYGGVHIVTSRVNGDIIYQHIYDKCVRVHTRLISYKKYGRNITTDETTPQVLLSCGDSYINRHDLRMNPGEVNQVLARDCNLFHLDNNPRNFNEFIVCGVADSYIRMYDQRNTKETLKVYSPFSKKRCSPGSALFNHNGTEILATYRHEIYTFKYDTLVDKTVSFLYGITNHKGILTAKFFGPDSQYVVSGSECGRIFMWNKDTEGIVQCIVGDDDGEVRNLVCHPHEPYLCSTGLDKEIKMWLPKREFSPESIYPVLQRK